MKLSQYLTASIALVTPTIAGPVHRRATDADILNYALTLEHLEDAFYRQGLANFTQADFTAAGYDSTFYQNLKEISYDESTHVSFLTSALKAAGAPAVAECTYRFPVTNVASFLATASVLEGVGVTAYTGGAASIASKTYLTAAASILTVESRHSAYLRAVGLKQRPFPQAFDVPLTPMEVYTLAAPFIISCPSSNPAFLPLKAFPSLSLTSKGTVLSGSSITVSYASTYNGPSYAAFITVTGPVWATITSIGNSQATITVPAGVHGQSYLVLSKDSKIATDDTIIAGPAIVEISGQDGTPGTA